MDVREFTVGQIQENAYIVRVDEEAKRALMIDPGEEPERLLEAVRQMGVEIEAILITHCHFDHIGAVAPVAKATGAPVICPEIERRLLSDIMRWVPPGFGPFESYEADRTVAGGERLQLAGMDIEVLSTPGHSPGHVTYAITAVGEEARSAGKTPGDGLVLLSGDVLFAGSVGRVDLPGGNWETLEKSIQLLMERFPGQTGVFPGHMGMTTLGAELQANPFLTEIRQRLAEPMPAARRESGS